MSKVDIVYGHNRSRVHTVIAAACAEWTGSPWGCVLNRTKRRVRYVTSTAHDIKIGIRGKYPEQLDIIILTAGRGGYSEGVWEQIVRAETHEALRKAGLQPKPGVAQPPEYTCEIVAARREWVASDRVRSAIRWDEVGRWTEYDLY